MGHNVGSKFGKPVNKKQDLCDDIVMSYTKIGVEVEVESCPAIYEEDVGGALSLWESHPDGSLRNSGMEFTTRGGLSGKKLIKSIHDLCEWLKIKKCSTGFPRAGIHLHMDVTDLNEDDPLQLANLVASYMLFETAMFRWAEDGLDRWCRESCGFCDPLTKSTKDLKNISTLLYKWDKTHVGLNGDNFSKYQAVNFLPLARFGTLEFRHLPTTFDADRIIKWINLCLSFKAFSTSGLGCPLEFYMKHGLGALMSSMFGKHLPDIARFVDDREVRSNFEVALFMKTSSEIKPSLDSWDAADNLILLNKKKPKPAVSKKKLVEPDLRQPDMLGIAPFQQHVAHVARIHADIRNNRERIRRRDELAFVQDLPRVQINPNEVPL